MAGMFSLKSFSDINLEDPFFDSLKADYPGTANSTGFEKWFYKKASQGERALVFEDDMGLGAFIVLKDEEDVLELFDRQLPRKRRIKISTIKIAERHRGVRHGEGAIGLVLWEWQKSGFEEIYVTVFDKQLGLIAQLEKFGFSNIGQNMNGERIYLKDKRQLDFSNQYTSFPFIKSGFNYAGYIIIDENYHDTMFAYSELANKKVIFPMEINNSVRNGISKIYVGQAPVINHTIGEPVFIYRKSLCQSGRRYRSCITSYGVVTDTIQAKVGNRYLMTFEELVTRIGNKSVFDRQELYEKYMNYKNVSIVELLYYGYFGAGNNINMDWLDNNGCWVTMEKYPTEIHLSESHFKKILKKGNINVSNVIID